MSTKSHARRQIVWDAAHKAVYVNLGAEYRDDFKTVADDRFDRFYRQIAENYHIQEARMKEMEEIYGEIY